MIIHEILENLIGLHCWDVYYHHDLNLSMSFGQPIMRIREPKKVRSQIERVRQVRAHRLITVRGEWWLWIISAYWKLSVRGSDEVTGTSSLIKKKRALALLDGQKLTGMTVHPTASATQMEFDLGAKLSIRRYSSENDGDIWSLYQPNGYVLSVGTDGKYRNKPGSRPTKQNDWKPIVE